MHRFSPKYTQNFWMLRFEFNWNLPSERHPMYLSDSTFISKVTLLFQHYFFDRQMASGPYLMCSAMSLPQRNQIALSLALIVSPLFSRRGGVGTSKITCTKIVPIFIPAAEKSSQAVKPDVGRWCLGPPPAPRFKTPSRFNNPGCLPILANNATLACFLSDDLSLGLGVG